MKFLSKIKNKLNKLFRIFFPLRINKLKYFQNKLKNLNGLEIGGPSALFEKNGFLPLYDLVKNLDGCNFSNQTIWEGKIKHGTTFKYGKRLGTQFIAEASDLNFIDNNFYDFVVSSHCLEHVANPIKALLEWKRIIKDSGYLLLILPHKNGTFDRFRPVTTLTHLIEDFNANVDENDKTHFDEIYKLHDFSRHPDNCSIEEFKKRTELNFYNRCVHHHVFDEFLPVKLLEYVNFAVLDIQFVPPFNIVIFAQKYSDSEKSNNNNFKKLSTTR